MTEFTITNMRSRNMGQFVIGLKSNLTGKQVLAEVSYPDSLHLFAGLQKHFKLLDIDTESEIK